ncbi:protein of unknown function DUF362 [Clostridium sp. DL-VIII]|uniref:DUF362 domain-containing protein n=1 Tax=Clostridium sp. DL-VIII TaxID=641107 RepID=UPI00023AF19F|nr:DUF362 domain-containing protein [Clostridium sp. DL-VIII]EHI97610.1 protein of unknown function DUF362 [Clostridium sp. DL-VIII]
MSEQNKLSRRQFLGGMAVGLVAAGLSGCGVNVRSNSGGSQNNTSSTASSSSSSTSSAVDKDSLLAISGTDPAALIEKGFSELGGIGQFIKSGNTVVIKANFSVPRKPEEAATTNPDLVAAVVKQCLSAGAKAVNVVDFPFSGPTCLVTSGIKDAVEKAGGKAYNINAQNNFQSVDMGGDNLKSVLFSKDVLNADVFINMPILKNHMMAKVTMSMKNMMGLVWDRGYFHSTDLASCIAELSRYRKADLIIMDAIKGIIDHGPTGPGTIKEWNQVVFGFDPVAVDAYGANLFGVDPNDITYIVKASQLGVGNMDLSKITVKKLNA